MKEQNKLPTAEFAQIIGFLPIISTNSADFFFNYIKLGNNSYWPSFTTKSYFICNIHRKMCIYANKIFYNNELPRNIDISIF
jgi:hypothetical protein